MKLCVAGTYCYRTIYEKCPSKYVLESFYYISKWQHRLIHECDLFLLDSGAFTFMNKKNSKERPDFDQYLESYIDFINQHDVRYFFELDIDSVVGYEKVKQLRKRLEEGTHKKCIPVWHKSRGLDEWIKLCEEYDYVAIGGIVTREITKKDTPILKKLVHIAKTKGTKVHGLGFTGADCMDIGFYSIDSTGWIASVKFGGVGFFDGKNITNVSKPEGKVCKTWRIRAEQSLSEWLKYQTYLDNFY